MARVIRFVCLVCLFGTMPVSAQQPAGAPAPAPQTPAAAPAATPAGPEAARTAGTAETFELVTANHWRWTGKAIIQPQTGVKFFADQVDWFTDTSRIEATGNVVFSNPEGRIAAERVEFNLATGTGTFFQASGLMSVGAQVDRTQFGNQDPDVYFTGETIEKLGGRRYRITHGSFSTCVQPTPRWELVSGSMVINLNEYAIARNTVLRVKGVPLMYLPVVYYPIQEDERATGFLLPTYGTSTYRGQAISNAFFWAINRSQDATFFHDWFTKAGQGAGGEYRFIAGPQSLGNFRFYRFNRSRQITTDSSTGDPTIVPANTSYEIVGTATHAIGSRFRARARMDYFSNLFDQQLLHQNVYQATRRSRVIEGGLTGGFGPVSTSAVYQRQEAINSNTNSIIYGSTPRATASIAAQRLFNSPIYGSMNSDFGFLPYREMNLGIETLDNSFGRFDIAPSIRVPLSKLTFLSVNTSASYRTTYYTRSLDAKGAFTDESFLRQYAALRTDVVGPVFTRIWDLPESGFAERMKHVIEPAFTVDTTSPLADYKRTPTNSDISDFVVGGATRFTYGITNRLFFRGRGANGGRGQTREFVTVGVQQTYYSNADSSRSDTSYQSSTSGRLVDLSPIALNARVSPSGAFDANGHVEYDVSGGGLQVLSAGWNLNTASGSTGINYSRRHFVKAQKPDDFLSASTRFRLLQSRATGSYAITWDIAHSYIASQTVMATYMAQCCGLQVEFQKYNYLQSSDIPFPSDRRFTFGFILAGLGTFSNFFGAFGGQQ